MKLQASLLSLSWALSAVEAQPSNQCLNSKVNFSYDGALTDDRNRALICFGGLLGDCGLFEEYKQKLDAANFNMPGLSQQVDYALESLQDAHKNFDLFMIYGAGE